MAYNKIDFKEQLATSRNTASVLLHNDNFNLMSDDLAVELDLGSENRLTDEVRALSVMNYRIDQWAFDRFGESQNISTQGLKLGSEYSEMMLNLSQNTEESMAIISDDIGDQLVVLTSIARLSGEYSLLNILTGINGITRIEQENETNDLFLIGFYLGEIQDNIIKSRDLTRYIASYVYHLENFANNQGLNVYECWLDAWSDIKDRKGKVNAEGNFIKDSDTSGRENR